MPSVSIPVIARLAADIALLDKRLAEILAGDAMLARRYAYPCLA
jgi:hypothetical protein